MNLLRRTFLVVDGLDLTRTATVTQLRAMGCEKVHIARNGAEALRILKAYKVDGVLADWNIPGMSGLALLRAIRADAKLARMPFLMITAEAERQQIEEVISAGVSTLLVKPYNGRNLEARLKKILVDSEQPTPRRGLDELLRDVPVVAPVAARPEGDPALASARILVVDDYPVSLTLLAHLFKDEYEVQTASDGESALALCAARPEPDLVLMDVMMPAMDGFEVVRRMREHPTMAQIPVIFVTDLKDESAQLKGMALGAVDFVSKNSDPKVLRSRVRNFIKFVDMRRQLQADFDAMLEAARRRDEVDSVTRHELKGSLNGLVGLVQNLASEDDLAPAHASQLRLIEQTAEQIVNMVNLSSELYKMETGKFKLAPAPVDVGDILLRLVEQSRAQFADKRLSVMIDADTPVGTEKPTAVGDAMLCFALFQNLIKNACEAAPPGSRVVVTLKDENPLCVLVHNSGVVPPELRETFFEKFSTGGKPGGSGIGTYAARLLATAQSGSVAMATDDTDTTTTLTVTLPRHIFNPQARPA